MLYCIADVSRLILLLPCAVCEVPLLLRDVSAQFAKRRSYLWQQLLLALLSPFLVVGFTAVLLRRVLRGLTCLKVSVSGSQEVYYPMKDRQAKVHSTGPRQSQSGVRNSVKGRGSFVYDDVSGGAPGVTRLSVRVDRGEFQRDDELVDLAAYVTVRIRDQILVTPLTGNEEEVRDMCVYSWGVEQDFFVSFSQQDYQSKTPTKRDDLMVVEAFDSDDSRIGRAVVPIKEWVANGRFEGTVELHNRLDDGDLTSAVKTNKTNARTSSLLPTNNPLLSVDQTGKTAPRRSLGAFKIGDYQSSRPFRHIDEVVPESPGQRVYISVRVKDNVFTQRKRRASIEPGSSLSSIPELRDLNPVSSKGTTLYKY